jgi:hypothetical protein
MIMMLLEASSMTSVHDQYVMSITKDYGCAVMISENTKN